jgi:hypothetical protein
VKAWISGFGVLALLATAARAEPSPWQVEGSPSTPPFRLSLTLEDRNGAYQFECGPDEVRVTETGVTDLMDVFTGAKVDTAPGTIVPEGALSMALYTREVKSPMTKATAVPNATEGWDLTIVLPKTDAAFRSLATSKVVSLATTGWTTAVTLDDEDRKVIAGFVARCVSPKGAP